MIARQLCGLVAQSRACLEADCSFALVRQRVPALNDTKKKKGTGYLSRAVRSARPHMLCRTKDGYNGRPEARGVCVIQEEPVDELQENE